jgi:hypothetical protein
MRRALSTLSRLTQQLRHYEGAWDDTLIRLTQQLRHYEGAWDDTLIRLTQQLRHYEGAWDETLIRLTQQLRHYEGAWDDTLTDATITSPKRGWRSDCAKKADRSAQKKKSKKSVCVCGGGYATHLLYSADSGSHMYVAEMIPRIASGSLAAVG